MSTKTVKIIKYVFVLRLRFPIVIYLMSVYNLEKLRLTMSADVETFNKLFDYLEDDQVNDAKRILRQRAMLREQAQPPTGGLQLP